MCNPTKKRKRPLYMTQTSVVSLGRIFHALEERSLDDKKKRAEANQTKSLSAGNQRHSNDV